MGDVTVELNGPAYQRKAALHHPLHKRSTELDFWKMMMPADLNIIEATNLHTEMAQKPLDYEQLQHFFGILLVMTLASGGERRDMYPLPLLLGGIWPAIPCPCSWEVYGLPFPAPALGRYMACHSLPLLLGGIWPVIPCPCSWEVYGLPFPAPALGRYMACHDFEEYFGT